MKRVSLILAVAVLLASAVAGGAVAQSDGDDLYETLEEMVPAYNANADAVDFGPVSLAGTTNVYVRDGDTERTYSITMDDRNRITALDDSRSDDAVRKITTDRATLDGIAAADNPAAAFRTAVANDDIVISGEDGQFVEGIKWAVINFFKGFVL
jgi:ABC-type glycerol-3-phosphate transport system substrate-binding protein